MQWPLVWKTCSHFFICIYREATSQNKVPEEREVDIYKFLCITSSWTHYSNSITIVSMSTLLILLIVVVCDFFGNFILWSWEYAATEQKNIHTLTRLPMPINALNLASLSKEDPRTWNNEITHSRISVVNSNFCEAFSYAFTHQTYLNSILNAIRKTL